MNIHGAPDDGRRWSRERRTRGASDTSRCPGPVPGDGVDVARIIARARQFGEGGEAPRPATGGTARAVRVANVRVAPDTGAPLGGSRQLQPGQTFAYTELVHGQTVSQNGVTTDLWYHSRVGNYVWSGNCEKV